MRFALVAGVPWSPATNSRSEYLAIVPGMLPALDPAQDHALALTPTGELLQLPFLSAEAIPNSGAAYAMSKRADHLRVQAASITWGERGARVNLSESLNGLFQTEVIRRGCPERTVEEVELAMLVWVDRCN